MHVAVQVQPGRRWPRRLLIASNVIVALSLIGAGSIYGYVRYRNSQIKRIAVGDLGGVGSGDPMTILLVGSNTRTGLNPAEAKQFGTASQVGGARSDVTMLVHLEPKTRTVTVLSIPRDLFVPIPGSDRLQRVDAALNAGPTQLVQTLQSDLGIPINHYVELNFDTFQSVVNTLGGLDMYFPTPVRDSFSGLNVGSGCVHLGGAAALAVVRARHLQYEHNGRFLDDPYGDLSRIRRNHEFLRVLAGAVQHRGLSNLGTVNSLVGSVAPNLKVDSGMTLSTMVSLARRFRSVDVASVQQMTLPVSLAPHYVFRGVDYGDVVLPSEPLDQQVIIQFLGHEAPVASTAPATVALVNQSGLRSAATTTAAGLRAAGFTVASSTSAARPARPAESVILYPPGKLAAAQQLQSFLSGSVGLGTGTPPGGADLELLIGTDLKVLTRPTGSAPGSATTTSAAPSTTAKPATGVLVNGNVVTVQESPQSFDPTACPAGPTH